MIDRLAKWWRLRNYLCLECGELLDADGVCPEVARQRAEYVRTEAAGVRPIQSWPTAEGQP